MSMLCYVGDDRGQMRELSVSRRGLYSDSPSRKMANPAKNVMKTKLIRNSRKNTTKSILSHLKAFIYKNVQFIVATEEPDSLYIGAKGEFFCIKSVKELEERELGKKRTKSDGSDNFVGLSIFLKDNSLFIGLCRYNGIFTLLRIDLDTNTHPLFAKPGHESSVKDMDVILPDDAYGFDTGESDLLSFDIYWNKEDPRKSVFAIGGVKKTLKVYDTVNGNLVFESEKEQPDKYKITTEILIYGLLFSSANEIAVCTSKGEIRSYNTEGERKPVYNKKVSDFPLKKIKFIESRNVLLVSDTKGNLIGFDCKSLRVLGRYKEILGCVTDIEVLDEDLVITVSLDGYFRIHSFSTREFLFKSYLMNKPKSLSVIRDPAHIERQQELRRPKDEFLWEALEEEDDL